tara:strand:+ start:935 stop:1939 length:1005 start_codon:yes stop_codon:yes gene_type:complete
MKKFLLPIIFLTNFCISNSVKANDYTFLKGSNLSDGYQIYGVNAGGESSLLNTWSAKNSWNESLSGSLSSGLLDQYNGTIIFSVTEMSTSTGETITDSYTLSYDLINNSFTDLGNTSINDKIAYPKGIKQMISEKSDGSIHIGENSAVFKEENGREKFWAQDANGKSIPIDITNGSKLLINGRDVEQSINNVGALSAALTGLPTVPTDTNLACGLGTGTHGGDFAFSGGCASKVNEKLSINYAASMTMPGQEYAGDFEDTFSARAGFIWKLGKTNKPTQISMKAKEKMEAKIGTLTQKNEKLQNTVSTLMARLERLEKIASTDFESQDLASIKD